MNPEDRQFEEELMKLAKNTHPNPNFQQQLAEQLRDAQESGPMRVRPRWSVAAAAAPFPVKAPTYLPEGFTIIDASYDSGANQTSIFFGTSFDALNLVQTPLEDVEPFDIGESADVTEVQIGEYTGEFVRGIWLANVTPNEDETRSVEGREWNPDFPFEQLVWTDGEYRYWLSSVMGQGTSLSLDEWVRVAESLQ